MAIEINDTNFEELIVKSGKPALVDFWAEWCGPCRMISPIIDELSKIYSDKVIIGKVDVDNCPNISTKYGIRSIPTLLFFKNGEIVDKQLGAVPRNTIEDKIKSLL